MLFIFVFIPASVLATTISPIIIEAQLDPGQAKTYKIQLYNETKEDIFLNGSIEKFVPKGENGEAQILPFDISDKAVNWLKLPNNSLILKADEEISVSVIIDVPKTADVGGYYLAIMWESSAGPKSIKNSQTLVSSRVGALVLLEVMGEVNSNLEIVNFDLKTPQNFYNGLPIDFLLRLRNYGNIHLRPQGSIIIKNFLGQTVEALPLNDKQGAILPNTTRIFETVWGLNGQQNLFSILANQLTHFTIGRFSAQALVTYDNKSLDSNIIYFWVMPWPILVLILILLVIIIVLTKILKKKKKK